MHIKILLAYFEWIRNWFRIYLTNSGNRIDLSKRILHEPRDDEQFLQFSWLDNRMTVMFSLGIKKTALREEVRLSISSIVFDEGCYFMNFSNMHLTHENKVFLQNMYTIFCYTNSVEIFPTLISWRCTNPRDIIHRSFHSNRRLLTIHIAGNLCTPRLDQQSLNAATLSKSILIGR